MVGCLFIPRQPPTRDEALRARALNELIRSQSHFGFIILGSLPNGLLTQNPWNFSGKLVSFVSFSRFKICFDSVPS